MLTSIAVFGQAFNAATARQEAVKYIKRHLVCPSSFKMTDRYGNTIPQSKASCVFQKAEEKRENRRSFRTVYNVPDSVYYYYTITGELIDSIVWSNPLATTTNIYNDCKVNYPAHYVVKFYYEANNRAGGREQYSAKIYYYQNGDVCNYLKEKVEVLSTIEEGKKETKYVSVTVPKEVYKAAKKFVMSSNFTLTEIESCRYLLKTKYSTYIMSLAFKKYGDTWKFERKEY